MLGECDSCQQCHQRFAGDWHIQSVLLIAVLSSSCIAVSEAACQLHTEELTVSPPKDKTSASRLPGWVQVRPADLD